MHAAVIAINDAVDKQVPSDTMEALQNPMAHLVNIRGDLQDDYQDMLYGAKNTKAEIARNKVMTCDSMGRFGDIRIEIEYRSSCLCQQSYVRSG